MNLSSNISWNASIAGRISVKLCVCSFEFLFHQFTYNVRQSVVRFVQAGSMAERKNRALCRAHLDWYRGRFFFVHDKCIKYLASFCIHPPIFFLRHPLVKPRMLCNRPWVRDHLWIHRPCLWLQHIHPSMSFSSLPSGAVSYVSWRKSLIVRRRTLLSRPKLAGELAEGTWLIGVTQKAYLRRTPG